MIEVDTYSCQVAALWLKRIEVRSEMFARGGSLSKRAHKAKTEMPGHFRLTPVSQDFVKAIMSVKNVDTYRKQKQIER